MIYHYQYQAAVVVFDVTRPETLQQVLMSCIWQKSDWDKQWKSFTNSGTKSYTVLKSLGWSEMRTGIWNDEVVVSVWVGGRLEERYWCEVRADPLPPPWKQGENFWSSNFDADRIIFSQNFKILIFTRLSKASWSGSQIYIQLIHDDNFLFLLVVHIRHSLIIIRDVLILTLCTHLIKVTLINTAIIWSTSPSSLSS